MYDAALGEADPESRRKLCVSARHVMLDRLIELAADRHAPLHEKEALEESFRCPFVVEQTPS